MGKKRSRLDKETAERLFADWQRRATEYSQEDEASASSIRPVRQKSLARIAPRTPGTTTRKAERSSSNKSSPAGQRRLEEVRVYVGEGLSLGEIAAIYGSSISEIRELLVEAAVAELDEAPRRVSGRRPNWTAGLIQRWIDLYETPEPIIILAGRMTVSPPVESIDLSGLRPLPGSGLRYRARKRDPRPRIAPQDHLSP